MSSNDEPYDVAVVGPGALGSAIVRPLSERGARVLGLDRHAPPHDQRSRDGHPKQQRRLRA